jgi:hypothetical protein
VYKLYPAVKSESVAHAVASACVGTYASPPLMTLLLQENRSETESTMTEIDKNFFIVK